METQAQTPVCTKNRYWELLGRCASDLAQDSERFASCLRVQGRLRSYSPGNVILISTRCPNAMQVRTRADWVRIGCQIRRGARGIPILKPAGQYLRRDGSVGQNYQVIEVYDISQTDAELLEASCTRQQQVALFEALTSYQAGAWVVRSGETTEAALYDATVQAITIRENQPFPAMFSALARETVCADMDLRYGMQREQALPIASCVALMLCSAYSISPDSLELPSPKIILGTDAAQYCKRLKKLQGELLEITNRMDRRLARDMRRPAEKERRTTS